MKFPKIKAYYSFNPENRPRPYTKYPADPKIVNHFFEDIKRIRKSSDLLFCSRGTSESTIEEHSRLFGHKLYALFMLGDKAKAFLESNSGIIFTHHEGLNNEDLIGKIRENGHLINREIAAKPQKHKLFNKLTDKFFDSINAKPITLLRQINLFLIAWLHNNGHGRLNSPFKNFSPLVSVTYGPKQLSKARSFALYKNKSGYILLVVLNKNNPRFFFTKDMIQLLAIYNINWYPDNHNEIMIVNGILPHYILGVIEVKKNSTPQLIINPWLYREYLEGRCYDQQNGIPIDQIYLGDWLRNSQYSDCYFSMPDGDDFVSDERPEHVLSKVTKFSPDVLKENGLI